MACSLRLTPGVPHGSPSPARMGARLVTNRLMDAHVRDRMPRPTPPGAEYDRTLVCSDRRGRSTRPSGTGTRSGEERRGRLRQARQEGPAARRQPNDRLHDGRGLMVVAGRVAGRQDDRVRVAGRPLHACHSREERRSESPTAWRSTVSRATRQMGRGSYVPLATAAAPTTSGSAKADGTDPKAITKEKTQTFRSPEWTPDGKYIIVSRLGGTPPVMSLYLYHVDGGSGVKLTGNSEDQRTLYALGRRVRQGSTLRLFHRANGRRQRLQPDELPVADRRLRPPHRSRTSARATSSARAMRPVLSPDGRWLVYATRWDAQTGLRAPRPEERRRLVADLSGHARRSGIGRARAT